MWRDLLGGRNLLPAAETEAGDLGNVGAAVWAFHVFTLGWWLGPGGFLWFLLGLSEAITGLTIRTHG